MNLPKPKSVSMRWGMGTSIIALLIIGFFSSAARAQQSGRDGVGDNGMVVSVSPDASDAGAEILSRGGNAVDAAVATAFAMAVTHPSAGNIGGGGFMMIYPSDGRPPVMIDYREKAPLAATRDLYANDRRRSGPRIVGVPGTVAGLYRAHREYGKLPWKEVVMPAVSLAGEGFVMHGGLASGLNGLVRRSAEQFPELVRVFGKAGGDEQWAAGDRIIQSDLASTLQRIADHGPEDFYRGKTAQLLVAEMQRGDGLITLEDLAQYEAQVREPIHTTFRGYDVYGPPPPSSGGIALTMMLNMLEGFDLKAEGRYSTKTVHLMIEAMRRAYADRAKFLGDSDFVEIPAYLTTKEYAQKLAAGIDLTHATPSDTLGPPITMEGESEETTHFSVIDGSGMAVSNTYTLEGGWGSRVVVQGAGFLLNNEMGDFNGRPGVTDRRGSIGTAPNQIEPGKRMLSSMTPVIVAKDGKVHLVTGSPGGRTIINTVVCVVLNVLEFDMNIRDAVDAPRMDHEWFPERVRMMGARSDEFAGLVEALTAMGHDIQTSGGQGDANSILVKDGKFYGAADGRNGKASAGK